MRLTTILDHSSYSGNIIIPSKRDWRLNICLNILNVKNIGYVGVDRWIHANINDCHNNVNKYVNWYGGERIIGYYWLEDIDHNTFYAISHSIVNTRNGIRDITPFNDQRPNNLFSSSTHSPLEQFSSSRVIYGFKFNFS